LACKFIAYNLSELLLLQPSIDGGAGLLHVKLYELCYLNNSSYLLCGGLSCPTMLSLLAATTQVTTFISSMISRLWEGADALECKFMACNLSDLSLSQPGIDGGAGLLHVKLYENCYLNNSSCLLCGGLSCPTMLALLAATTQVTTFISSMIARLWEGADARACKFMACNISDLSLSQPGIDGGAGLLHVKLYENCYLNNSSCLLCGGLSCPTMLALLAATTQVTTFISSMIARLWEG
jgi:hypothetical protein